MTASRRFSLPVILLVSSMLVSGCTALPGGTVTNAATVVYTSGASQFTAAVELQAPADEVFAAMISVIKGNPDVEIASRNDKAYLVEVKKEKERRFTGQVTRLGSGDSLLYIWANAGSSGQSGQEMAINAVELVCDELGVDYELVQY